jgi:hypothetical protein
MRIKFSGVMEILFCWMSLSSSSSLYLLLFCLIYVPVTFMIIRKLDKYGPNLTSKSPIWSHSLSWQFSPFLAASIQNPCIDPVLYVTLDRHFKRPIDKISITVISQFYLLRSPHHPTPQINVVLLIIFLWDYLHFSSEFTLSLFKTKTPS